jgi:hypothetical protein
MPSIRVRDDRAKIIHVRGFGELLRGKGETSVALFPVMEKLSLEKMCNLVWDSV